MYVEKITKEDLNERNFLDMKVEKFNSQEKSDKNCYYLKFSREGYGPSLELIVSDFSCEGINTYASALAESGKILEIRKKWVKCLHDIVEEKYGLGSKYKSDFLKYVTNQAEILEE